MKHSSKINAGRLLAVTLLMTIAMAASGQGINWRLFGNNNASLNSFLGTTNAQPLVIKTNSSERIRITPDGKILIRNYVYVADSMRVVGPFMIGNRSMTLLDDVPDGFLNLSDHFRSDQGCFSFFRGDATAYNSNVRVGIGIHNPLQKLHLHDATAANVAMLFTNAAAVNGLAIGIRDNGNGEIRMQDYFPLLFFTNNQQRMVITKDEGYVGMKDEGIV
ncbi:MAG: hypothetical protein KKA07_07715 [Bacteroidetes bacterium]|nr:hypothetical protein [Bacteroidota bacterium]